MEFEGQRSDEQVLRVFRKHPVVLLGHFFVIVFLGTIGLVLILTKWFKGAEWLGLGIVFLSTLKALFLVMKWYFTIYILTNLRLRFIDQKGLFSRASIDLFFQDIDSVSLSVNGVLADFLHFGDIIIEARAGELFIKQLGNASVFYNSLQNNISQSRKVG